MTSQVTGSPTALARRTSSSAAAVDTWVRCNRAPGTSRQTSARIARSRPTAASSAAAGQPRSPRTVATNPSFASAPSVRVESSGWSTIGNPSAPAYASAFRRIEADRTGAPSSEKPTTPASASSPSAARVFPARPVVTAPWASSSTGEPEASAAARTSDRTPGSSRAGVVLGIAQTVVNPPCAAAASPVATVSASSLPGSRRCTCRSMNPGATTTPPASIPSASSRSSHVTASRIPSRTTISPGPSRPAAGSTSHARPMSRSVTWR